MQRLILIFALLLPLSLALAQPGIWSNSVNVSNNSRPSRHPDICIDSQAHIHLVWGDNGPIGSGNSLAILYKYFDGCTWSFPAVQISESAITEAVVPQIALDHQDRPRVVWSDSVYYYDGYFATIKYSHKEEGVWSSPLNLSLDAHYNWRPHILFDSVGWIYVFWDGTYNGYHHVLYRIYDGNQWGPILDATPSAGLAWDSEVKIDAQDNLHVIYVQGEGYSTQIFYTHNEGLGWSQPSLVTVAAGSQPDLCLDGNGDPHAVWRQDIPNVGYEIFYSHLNMGTWMGPVNISQLSGDCYYPCIAISAGMRCVSFCYGPTGINSILAFVESTDSLWSTADTVFYGLPNMILESTMAFDTATHLQLVSSVPLGGVNSDIYHVAYINSSVLPTSLTPHSPPITIPASGGSFHFDFSVSNQAVLGAVVDFWFDLRLPNGHINGPLLIRQNLNLIPHATIARSNLTQNIPATAPAGSYYFRFHAGDYPSTPVSSDSFAFTKSGVENGLPEGGGWSLTGWEGEDEGAAEEIQPNQFSLRPPSPNPFNSSTVASYELRVPSQVSLRVYDTAGRLVSSLVDGWQEAGTHSDMFDGSKLAAGVYLYVLTAGEYHAAGKMVLLK